jgi:hypothetical protein
MAKRTQPRDNATLLIKSDLGLYDWLEGEAISVDTAEFGAPVDVSSVFKQNVLFHKISFDVLASGNITPALSVHPRSYRGLTELSDH